MQTKAALRDLSRTQNQNQLALLGDLKLLENDQAKLNRNIQEEMLENKKQQQDIINSLSMISGKLDDIEITQRPNINGPSPVVHLDSYQKKIGPKRISMRRSQSADRWKRKPNNNDRDDHHKTYTTLDQPFSERLQGSIDNYYRRIKRDPIDVRNVER